MNEKIRCLRENMKRLDLDAMIVSNPINIRYLTNIDSEEGLLIITRKENIYLTHTMFLEAVNSVLTIMDEIVVVDQKDISKDEAQNFFLFCENVGFEESYVTYEKYKTLKHKFRINSLVPTEGIVESQRIVKDEEEIKKIKKASEITDKCFSHLLEYIKRDMTEKEIALEIEIFMRKNGADRNSISSYSSKWRKLK